MDVKKESIRSKIGCKICGSPEGEMKIIICGRWNFKLLRKIYKCTGVRAQPSEGKLNPVCATCFYLIDTFQEDATPVYRDFVIEDQTTEGNLNYDPLCEIAPLEPIVEIVEPSVKIIELPDPSIENERKKKKLPKIEGGEKILILEEETPTPTIKKPNFIQESKPSAEKMVIHEPKIKSEVVEIEEEEIEIKDEPEEDWHHWDDDWELPLEESETKTKKSKVEERRVKENKEKEKEINDWVLPFKNSRTVTKKSKVKKNKTKKSELQEKEVEEIDDWELPLKKSKTEAKKSIVKESNENEKEKGKPGQKKKFGKGPQNCEICNKTYNDMRKHMKYHEIKAYQCDHCAKTFYKKSSLDYHIRTHTGERPFICAICEKGFYNSSNLKDHMIAAHTTEKKYQCDICSKRFNLSFKLTMHLKIHSIVKLYSCEICGKGFNDKNNRNVHVKRHMKIFTSFCAVCSKGFVSKQELKKHIKVHENDSTTSRNKKVNKVHEKVDKVHETGSTTSKNKKVERMKKPPIFLPEGLTCDICQKTFDKRNLLRCHRQLHFDKHGNPRKVREKSKLVIDERTPFCDICSRHFASNRSLRDHRLKHFSGGDTNRRAYRAIEKIPLSNPDLVEQRRESEVMTSTTIVLKSEFEK